MIHITDEDSMKAFGARIGRLLSGGEVIELIGDVGAGKTTFVKGLAQGLGIDEDIQSPSFTISRVYEARDKLHLAHYDFYRLNEAGIMANELSEATSRPDTIVIIEWADIVENVLPEQRLTLRLAALSETERSVDIQGTGIPYHALLEELV